MEIGTLAEWVTGISNVVAVCIALFLPLYQQRKEKRAAKLRICRLARDLTNSLVQIHARNPQTLQSTKEFDELNLLKTVSAITDSDVINPEILQSLLLLFEESSQLDNKQLKKRANDLLALLEK